MHSIQVIFVRLFLFHNELREHFHKNSLADCLLLIEFNC